MDISKFFKSYSTLHTFQGFFYCVPFNFLLGDYYFFAPLECLAKCTLPTISLGPAPPLLVI